MGKERNKWETGAQPQTVGTGPEAESSRLHRVPTPRDTLGVIRAMDIAPRPQASGSLPRVGSGEIKYQSWEIGRNKERGREREGKRKEGGKEEEGKKGRKKTRE